jgi:hypothetical protein
MLQCSSMVTQGHNIAVDSTMKTRKYALFPKLAVLLRVQRPGFPRLLVVPKPLVIPIFVHALSLILGG